VNIIISLAFGFLSINVDNFGHIGGLISRFLLGFVLLIHPQYKCVRKNKSYCKVMEKMKRGTIKLEKQ
jgi:hypothetical protein